MLGRTFLAEEGGDSGVQPAAMISERLWTERFNRDPRIIGQTIRLNLTEVPVVGVLPGSFAGTDALPIFALDVWVPAGLIGTLTPGSASRLEARSDRNVSVFARLRPGTSLQQARAEVEALGMHLAKQLPASDRGRRLTVEYEETARRRVPATMMMVVLPIVGLVLLIACANVAGLLLGRQQVRRNEVAVRLALGASRRRLVRQLLTASAVLSVAGACLGLLVTFWVLRALPAMIPAGPLPIAIVPRLDPRVLVFMLAAALFAVPVFGLTPALLASRPDILPLLKGAGDQPTYGRHRITFRGVLVIGQISVALALLVCSALLVRSYRNASSIYPGFVPRPMAMATAVPPAIGYDGRQTRQFYATLLERLAGASGVERAAVSRHMPFNALYGSGLRRKVAVPGHEAAGASDAPAFRYNAVTPGYFDTMGLPILRGRDFSAADRPGSSYVVIINQTLAHQLWGADDVVGRHIVLLPDHVDATSRDCEVIGLARDAKYVTLTEPPEGYFYVPYAQAPGDEMTIIARGTDERRLAATLRREVAALDRAVPITQVTTMSAQVRTASIAEEVEATLVTAIGAVGVFLSMIGLYGVVSFAVARRTRDIGVRMALGARPADVIVDVLKQAASHVAIGGGVGLVLAAAAARLMQSALYGVSLTDPFAFGGAALLLTVVALGAAYLPARRAARIDPLAAIRCE
jgi:putative ABC transport system permease protein